MRYVETPSSNDDRSFYAAIAAALGVASGLSFNAQQMRLRVEEALNTSGLMLVFDECHFLIPQYSRPRGIPSRLQFLKTLFDAGTPLAMIGLHDFSKWQALYVLKTMWSDAQLERRLNRKIRLPETQAQKDFISIAQTLWPEGSKTAWKLLASFALASPKKQASAITEVMESANHLAEQDGRSCVTFDDVESAIRSVHLPSEYAHKAVTVAKIKRAVSVDASGLQLPRTDYARIVQPRDSSEDFTPRPPLEGVAESFEMLT